MSKEASVEAAFMKEASVEAAFMIKQFHWAQEAALGPRTPGNQSRRFPPSEN